MATIRSQHRSRTRLANTILVWLVKARRTLTIGGLRVAVSIREGATDANDEDMPDEVMVVEVCAGLVVVNERTNTVQLAHYSVQEYLESTTVTDNADLEVTMACLTFLSFRAFHHPCQTSEDIELRVQDSLFLRYASVYLYTHLGACEEVSTAVIYWQFLQNIRLLSSYVQTRNYCHDLDTTINEISPLHEASLVDHRMVTRQLLDSGQPITARATSHSAPCRL